MMLYEGKQTHREASIIKLYRAPSVSFIQPLLRRDFFCLMRIAMDSYANSAEL